MEHDSAPHSRSLHEIAERLDRIETLLAGQKNILTLREAAPFIGVSASHLYKLTSTNEIPHFKPNGKIIYFNRSELEAWMSRGRKASAEEIEAAAATHVATKGR
jgi:excisionase family DNA binding protein